MWSRTGEVFALDTSEFFEPSPDCALGAFVLRCDLFHVDFIVELAKQFFLFILRPRATGAGLAGRRTFEFRQSFKRQM